MASAGEGDARRSKLAGVKAVSGNYPLRGTLRIAPAPGAPDAPAARGPAPGCVWLDEQLVAALGAPVGSTIRLGRARFKVAAVLTLEPERGASFFNIAPRLMMNLADVPATGLVQTGSRVHYTLYAAGPPDGIRSFERFVRARLERGQHVDDLETGRPQVRASIDRAQRFLGLTAMLAAILAGVAIALGTRRFVERHLDGCAVMRCLGASQNRLLTLYGGEFLALGLAACAAGCVAGYGAQEARARALAAGEDGVRRARRERVADEHGEDAQPVRLLDAPRRAARDEGGGAGLRAHPDAHLEIGRIPFFMTPG